MYLEFSSYFHPHLTQGLIQYQGIITRFSARFVDHAWIQYDVLFRQKVAHNPSVPWGSEDSRLYHEILVGQEQVKARFISAPKGTAGSTCFICHAPGHRARFCSKALPDVCYKWNGQGGCVDAACAYRHACRLCGGGHPLFRCQNKGKR